MRPLFSIYGSKWRDARKYPPPHYQTLVEPFAGSAGYAQRYSAADVILCDLDPVMVGVWDYLIHVSPEEVLAIPDVPLDGCVDDLHLVQEAAWLIGFWLNKGTARPRKTPSKWMREQHRPNGYWGPCIRSLIASRVDSIRHWKVYNCSYDRCPIEGPATWFVDPPYQVAGKYYFHSSDAIDFEALGEWCRSRKGQVIVCENEGATWLPFRFFADFRGFHGISSTEMVWLNEDVANSRYLARAGVEFD